LKKKLDVKIEWSQEAQESHKCIKKNLLRDKRPVFAFTLSDLFGISSTGEGVARETLREGMLDNLDIPELA